MRILVHGKSGRMGQELIKLIESGYRNASLAGAVGRDISDFNGDVDCIIDFSNHAATEKLTAYAVRRKLPLVVATTGHSVEELKHIMYASTEIPVFTAANNGVGLPMSASKFNAFKQADYDAIFAKLVDGSISLYDSTEDGSTADLTLSNTTVTYVE